MEELKKSDTNFELTSKNINKDLIHFKNDILKDIRAIKLSFAEKYSILEENLKQKINSFDLTIKSFEQKITELSNLIIIDKSFKEKVESLNEFKEETRDNIFKQRAKFNEFETRITKEISDMNDILLDSVIYPGIIGGNSKFKTFHEYIDFTLKELAEISLIKDKNGMDLRPFKKKIEQNIDAFRIQINNMYTKEMTDNAINKTEEKLQNLFKLYDEKIMNLKVEGIGSNVNYANKIEELNSKLKSLDILSHNFEYDFEIKNMKKEIKKIYEILRDIFSFPEIKKELEKKNHIYSGVKQYINGFLNAEQLTSMKKFSFGNSNSNNKIMDKQHSAKISPFPTPDRIKTKNSFERKKLFDNNDFNNNSNEFLLEKQLSNSFKESNLKDKENVFISQKGLLINQVFSKDMNNNSAKKKIINKQIDGENKNNDEMNNLEKDYFFNNINLDNKIKKIYKEEEKIINKLNSYEQSNSKKLLEKNSNFIISEEDENVLSDNTNFFKEKMNKAKNKILKENIKNHKIISFNNSKKNISEKIINNNYTKKENGKQKDDYLGPLNAPKDKNKINNQNKNNLNTMKKLKEKEYNQSVPVLEIIKEQKPVIKLINKESVATQSEESQFYNRNQNSKILGNKTYTYFPHIKKEISYEKETILKPKKNSAFGNKNNFIKLKANSNSSLYNDENIQYNQNYNYYIKKSKKVLLINPDAISNYELRKTNKSANRNKSGKPGIGFKTQKNLNKVADEMIKGFIDKKKNRIIVSGSSNFQTYNSLYDIITSYEKTYGQNPNSKK